MPIGKVNSHHCAWYILFNWTGGDTFSNFASRKLLLAKLNFEVSLSRYISTEKSEFEVI